MNHPESIVAAARLFDLAIRDIAGMGKGVRVLDFGCGAGQLVENLTALGYHAAGCDSWATYDQKPLDVRLQKIEMKPYRLPFQDGEFEVVVSTSVFEQHRIRWSASVRYIAC